MKTFVLREDRIDEAPEVSIVSNRPKLNDGKPLVQAKHWHTDDSYLAAPATLTLLYAKTLPKDGGDTEFINCYDVLDALPAAMRSRVANLRAVHIRAAAIRPGSLNGPRKKKRRRRRSTIR